jgi:hypothetical protein
VRRRMNAMELAALVAIANQDASQGVTVDSNDPRLEALRAGAPPVNRHARRREAARARKRGKHGHG